MVEMLDDSLVVCRLAGVPHLASGQILSILFNILVMLKVLWTAQVTS